MASTLLKNATIINEGKKFESDLLIKNGRIEKHTVFKQPHVPEHSHDERTKPSFG